MAIRRRIVSAWISTVISLSLVLLLVGVGTLMLVNARAVSDYFKENMQVSVLLKEQVNEEEALKYQDRVAALPGVRSTHFVSREQGVEEMARMLGQDFLDVFETAPVPISIDVNLEAAYVSSDSLAVIKSILAESPLVEEVVYQTSLVDALNANLQKISLGLAILVALLFAALFAILLLVGGLFVLRDEFAQLFQIFQLDSLLLTMGVMALSGVGICVISTYIVVGRMVGYNRDKLYAY